MLFDPGQKIDKQDAHRIIKDIINCGHLIAWSNHAKERMLQRNYTSHDVLHILLNGNITKQEYHEATESWRYTIRGDDLEGDEGGVVTVVISKVKLVVITTLG